MAYKQEAVEKLHETANHLQVSEDRYRSLFEDSPISLWEEDFSAFKAYLDGVRAGGVTDFQTYFETHLEDLTAAQSQIIVRAVNRCTLEMYHAPSMAALIANQEAIFAPFSSHLLIQEATAIANGAQSFEVEGLNRDFDGGWLDVQMKWTVIPGYEADLSRIIVAIRDITAIKSRERELETVANVSAVLRGALTRASLLPLVLDQLSELLNTPSMAIGLIGADKHEVEFGIARGNWVRLMGVRLPFTSELAGPRIVASPVDALPGSETRQMHVSLDLRSEPGCGLVPYIDDDFSAVAAPLAAQGQTVGILWIGKAEAFKASDLRLIGIVADIAANAIHRLSLFEAIQLYGQQMAIISAAGRALSQTLEQPRQYVQAVETVFKLIPNVQRALLALYDPETQYLTYLRGEDAAGKYWTDDFQVALNRPYSPPGATAAVRDKQPVITNEVINKPGAGTQSTRLYSVMYVPMVAKDRVVGILQIEGKRENQFTAGDAEILMLFGNTTAVTIENARLFNDLDRMNQDLIESYDTTLEGWCRALDLRDEETEGHSQRVVALTLKLATAMGLNEALLVHLRRGALLHDIGKMGIPDAILKKKGPLDESEWRIMRQHPQHAYNMLAPIPYLRPALEIPLYHHEHYDGSGYPFGLRGDRIPLAARIFAVVDVWDALLADRPYRARWSPDRVVAYLREEAGRHFDPQVVETFLEIVAGQSET